MNSRELLRFSPLTPQFFTILFTGIGTIVLLLGHLIIVSGWSMASHDFSVKYTEITNHGQKTEKSVKKSYNKVVQSSGNSKTYRCSACGGRFTHDQDKGQTFEQWRDKKIAKCKTAKGGKGGAKSGCTVIL